MSNTGPGGASPTPRAPSWCGDFLVTDGALSAPTWMGRPSRHTPISGSSCGPRGSRDGDREEHGYRDCPKLLLGFTYDLS